MNKVMKTGFITVLNKYRDEFDSLCRQCELAGLARPHMNPGLFQEDRWELAVGEQHFHGNLDQVMDRALYFVYGYMKGITVKPEEAVVTMDPVETGEFRCTKIGGLLVNVETVSDRDATMVMGSDNHSPILVSKESAGTLAKFFTRLEDQLEEG